uniref:Uncharacterized protein n=1 Tax=Setaria italica TaxID=4555 RepID=K3ZDP7_SETIT
MRRIERIASDTFGAAEAAKPEPEDEGAIGPLDFPRGEASPPRGSGRRFPERRRDRSDARELAPLAATPPLRLRPGAVAPPPSRRHRSSAFPSGQRHHAVLPRPAAACQASRSPLHHPVKAPPVRLPILICFSASTSAASSAATTAPPPRLHHHSSSCSSQRSSSPSLLPEFISHGLCN